MKLLDKTNIYFVGVSLIVFCAGGVLFYFLFLMIIDKDSTNKLHARKNYVIKQIMRSDSLLLYQNFSGNTVSVKPIDRIAMEKEEISDTVLYDNVELKAIAYRQLAFNQNINGRNFRIHLRRALVETKDLIKGVIVMEALLFLAFVAILAVLNNLLSKRIWRPFYEILETINEYKVDRAESLNFEKNSTTEFNELSRAIEVMTAKINHEFNNQKEFTENASHEIQTPLATIKNKLEVLLQSPGLTEQQMNQINDASLAAMRLSKLNEALIILSRIENRQFHVVEDIRLNDLIDHHLSSLEELIQITKISVRKYYHETLDTKMNPFLADILFENLIVNAIKHNHHPGFMAITIENNKVTICNTGNELRGEPTKLFKRFIRGDQKSLSLGLGLSIVKAICETYLIPIHYVYEARIHQVRLEFARKQ